MTSVLSFGRILSVDDIDVPFVEVVEDMVVNLVLFKIFEIIGGGDKAKEL